MLKNPNICRLYSTGQLESTDQSVDQELLPGRVGKVVPSCGVRLLIRLLGCVSGVGLGEKNWVATVIR